MSMYVVETYHPCIMSILIEADDVDDAKQMASWHLTDVEKDSIRGVEEVTTDSDSHPLYKSIVKLSEQPQPDQPAWRERPTVPGWYLCMPEDSKTLLDLWPAVAMILGQQDIDVGAPFGAKCVYGPIPSPPEEMKP